MGCTAGPGTLSELVPDRKCGRGKEPGARVGPFWATVVEESDCLCDDEWSMVANNVKKPRVDVTLNPTTMTTFRAILRLDFPINTYIPNELGDLYSFLTSKSYEKQLPNYYEYDGDTNRWIFHGYEQRQAEGVEANGSHTMAEALMSYG